MIDQTLINTWIEFHGIIEVIKDFYPDLTKLSVIKRLLKNADKWENIIREACQSTKEVK